MAEENVLDRADAIMDEAVEKAGELLTDKPHIAEVILKQLLRCDPEHLSGLQLLGLCKHRMGDNAEAVEIISTALELDPDNPDNYNNLGLAYGGMGDHVRAIEAIRRAVELKPSQFLFKNNLALQYRATGDYDLAIETLKAGLSQQQKAQLWLNLGGIYGELRRMDDAKMCFGEAIKLDPEYPAAHVDLAFAHQLMGERREGFREYEWRFWYYPQMRFYMDAYDPLKWWTGKESLEGKRLLVYGEQGVGDTIQFVRYAKFLKARGAHVTFHCPGPLCSLIGRVDGVDATCDRDIMEGGVGLPEYDYHFSAMSAPHLLGLSDEVCGEPYIKPATTKFWDYLRQEHPCGFSIGVVWAGSPAHPHDRARSIPLKYFRPLHDVPGVKLFSMQVDTRPRQYGINQRNGRSERMTQRDEVVGGYEGVRQVVDYGEGCEGMKLVDLTGMIQSFEDTATIMAGLDLVVCCDTSVAHLAGAMGVPCWVAVPYNPDWRWGLDGVATAWYDSLVLFRQSSRGDWAGVFAEMERELRDVFAK